MRRLFRCVFNLYAGAFGDAVSYMYMGECLGFKRMLHAWARWEAEYARRGYRTISLDDFIDYGGYGKELGELAGVRRIADEKLVFPAEIYRQQFLGKVPPVIDTGELMKGNAQYGTYVLPSTKDRVPE